MDDSYPPSRDAGDQPPDDAFEPIHIETHRDLRGQIRAICKRINARPEIARRVLVNAVFAFEEVGVTLSDEMRAHVRKTLRWPERLETEKKEARAELLREHGDVLGKKVPRSPDARAALLFDRLGLEPERPEDKKGLDRKGLLRYVDRHPLVARLARYERAARGGLILHTRGSYEKFKSGERRHRWVKAVRFKV
ncbi:MAG: hypothetical protein AAGM22_05205 [Acidobacteriota bacterium]